MKTYILHEVSSYSAYYNQSSRFEGKEVRISENGYLYWANDHFLAPIYPHHETTFKDKDTGEILTKKEIVNNL